MLNIPIHEVVQLENFDDTLPILQNFEKTIFVKNLDLTSFKFSAFKYISVA